MKSSSNYCRSDTKNESANYRLTPVERETIIVFNERDPAATVSTCNRALINRLNGFAEQFDEIKALKEDEYGAEFIVPKNLVLVRKPRVISEEIRKAMSERMSRMVAERNFNVDSEG
jgi:hypothetical protein